LEKALVKPKEEKRGASVPMAIMGSRPANIDDWPTMGFARLAPVEVV
jgi:hypothetical protein